MDVAITGASGFIGSALARDLAADGHQVVRVSRRPGGPRTVVWDPEAGTIDAAGLEGVDAVVHLAGEGVASGPWTEAQRHRIRESRTKGTTLLAETLAGLERKPSVLLSGSAIGYYGDRGDEELTERATPGNDFLAQVCVAWEAAAQPAREAGIRVAHLRTGIVLGTEGGAFPKLLLPFKLGLGGKDGDGRGWWSWITLEDEIRAIRFLLEHDVQGPVNLTAPNPVRSAELAATLGRVLHRPAVLPVPRAVTKLPFGVGDLVRSLLFTSARVRPSALLGAGFSFRHTDFEDAVRAVLGRPAAA
jgi:uncharacterized protein (TIGR01777 family)